MHLFIDQVACLFGFPEGIVSDRDSKWTLEFWTAFTQQLQIKLAMSSAMHQQKNGQTERVNGILERMLRNYVNLHRDNWNSFLSMLEFAHNRARHVSTKLASFEVDIGRLPRRPKDAGKLKLAWSFSSQVAKKSA